MPAGKVDRNVLSSNYQDPGQDYLDTKTEAAFEVIAQQIDQNWDDYASQKVELSSTTPGDSGAHNVGSALIDGLTGANVYDQLSALKTQITVAATGAIPDGSIAKTKLTTSVQASLSKADGASTAIAVYGGVNGIDPNTATDAYILTQHVNNPTNNFYHIRTYFYLDKVSNRAQMAMRYNGGNEMYIRQCVSGVWTAWSRILRQSDYDTLFNSVDSGKTDIKTAIIGRGGTVAGTSPHSFSELVAGIGTIGIMPGDGIIASADIGRGSTSLTYVKVKSITINLPGTYRISFDLQGPSSGVSSIGRVYKNGAAIGIERVNNVSGSVVTYTEDFSFNPGDTVELWMRTSNTIVAAICSNFRVKANVTTVTLD